MTYEEWASRTKLSIHEKMRKNERCSGTELLSTGSPLKSSTARVISALNDYHHSVAVDLYHNDDQTKELGQASVLVLFDTDVNRKEQM